MAPSANGKNFRIKEKFLNYFCKNKRTKLSNVNALKKKHCHIGKYWGVARTCTHSTLMTHVRAHRTPMTHNFHEVNQNEYPHELFIRLFYSTPLNFLFYYKLLLNFKATLLSTHYKKQLRTSKCT